MHLLMIAGSYPPMKCGVGSYTRRLVRELASLDDLRVTVLTDVRAAGSGQHGKVEVLPVVKGWSILDIFRVARTIRTINPDIIHIQYPTQGFGGKIMPRFLPAFTMIFGKPCMQTWHEPMRLFYNVFLAINLKLLISVRKELRLQLPGLTRRMIRKVPFEWVPGASLLPTVHLSENQRADIRSDYLKDNETLLVFYGFMAPLKGIETLLRIVARTNAMLVLIGDFRDQDPYHRSIGETINRMDIASRVTFTGFLSDERLAEIIAASDAVVLPFKDGAGPWNTSIDGAVAQGVFVLSTSTTATGYNSSNNIYFARPGDVEEMVAAIERHAGCRVEPRSTSTAWQEIAVRHQQIYQSVI